MLYFLGRHNCIWCHIISKDLHKPPAERNDVPRTLETVDADFKNFRDVLMSDMEKAKENNNVVDEKYYDIPLDQVSYCFCLIHKCMHHV